MKNCFCLSLIITFLSILSLPSHAQQNGEMEVTDFTVLSTDLDARVNYPVKDWNDETCALIKVQTTLTGLSFDTGTIQPTKVEQKKGEVWVYVSPKIFKFHISHKDYTPLRYELPQSMEAATVYSLKLKVTGGKGNGLYVAQAEQTSDYLKLQIEPQNATVYIGKTQDYELETSVVTDGFFQKLLNYGEYRYKIESEYYETEFGVAKLDKGAGVQTIKLQPAYNYLKINSSPEQGADVFINGKYIGKTPLNFDKKIHKGSCTIKLTHRDYSPLEQNITLNGDGTVNERTFDLEPRYGTVTLLTSAEAEIWVDSQFKAKGKWTGRVSSDVAHMVEARQANHHSQKLSLTVGKGEQRTMELGAPVARLATINVTSTPALAKVYLDGEHIGDTPMVKQVLMGDHKLTLTKDGYIKSETSISLNENESRTFPIALEKGVIYVPVILTASYGTSILVDDKFMGTTSWKGELPEGLHTFTTLKENHKNGVLSVSLVKNGTQAQTIRLPEPEVQYGELQVKTNHASGYRVSIDGDSKSPADSYTVEAGDHKVSVSKSGYVATPTYQNVTLKPGARETLDFSFKKYRKPVKSYFYLNTAMNFRSKTVEAESSVTDREKKIEDIHWGIGLGWKLGDVTNAVNFILVEEFLFKYLSNTITPNIFATNLRLRIKLGDYSFLKDKDSRVFLEPGCRININSFNNLDDLPSSVEEITKYMGSGWDNTNTVNLTPTLGAGLDTKNLSMTFYIGYDAPALYELSDKYGQMYNSRFMVGFEFAYHFKFRKK